MKPQDLPETFSVDDLTQALTPEELEALKHGEDPLLDKDGKPTTDPDLADPQDSGPDKDEDANAAPPAAQAQAAPDAQPEPVAEAKREPVSIPDTTAAQATLEEVSGKLESLSQKYDDGEMTREEFNAALEKITNERVAAEVQIRSAQQIAAEAQRQTETEWLAALEQFRAAGNAALFEPQHATGFDAELRAVTADPANADLSFAKMIDMAARVHAAKFEARTGQRVALGAAPATARADQLTPRTDPRPDPVTTLSGLNGDGQASVDDGTWSAIDRMVDSDVFAAESRLAKFNDEDMDAYLRGTRAA